MSGGGAIQVKRISFDDGHWELVGNGYADYQLHGGAESEAAYGQLVNEFWGRLGRLPHSGGDEDLVRLVAALGIAGPLVSDKAGSGPVPSWLPATSDVARLVLDMEPAARVDACDLLLGPWADVFDIAVPGEHDAIEVAVADFCFTAAHGAPKTPFQRWCRQGRPIPTVEERAAFRALANTPFGVWGFKEEVRAGRDEAAWLVTDLIGIARPRSMVVQVGATANPFGPPRTGGALLGRIVVTEKGTVAPISLSVPIVPAAEQLARWVVEETLRARLSSRGISLMQLLCLRGSVVGRRVLEWLWGQGS